MYIRYLGGGIGHAQTGPAIVEEAVLHNAEMQEEAGPQGETEEEEGSGDTTDEDSGPETDAGSVGTDEELPEESDEGTDDEDLGFDQL